MASLKAGLVCLAVVAVASFSVADVAEKDEQGVFVLAHDNFDDTIRSSPVVVVYFHAPWCKKCSEFETNFTSLIEMSAGLENVAFAKLNVEDAQSLAEKYQVASFPSIIFFRDGTDYPHDESDRSASALFASVKSYASKGWTKPHQYSDHLTLHDFESTVKNGDGMLVKFYARWCGHCRAMGEEWDKAARVADKQDPPAKMYQVDCEAEKQLCSDNKVDSFPTLRFYRRGKFIEAYDGERKKDDFLNYMRRKTGDASRSLNATKQRVAEHISALHKNGQPAIIAFFTAEDNEVFDMYELVADDNRDKLELAHVFSESLARAYGIEGTHGIYLSQPEHLRSTYEDAVHLLNEFADDKDTLSNWLTEKSRPLVGHLLSHNTGMDSLYWNVNVATLYYTVDFSPDMIKSTQYWRKRFLRIAKDYSQHKDLVFAISDDEPASDLLKTIGLGDNAFDVAFVICGPEGKKYFPLDEDWDEDLYREHLDKFLAGDLEPYMKSEPVPARNNGPVKICVGKNFKKLFSPSKNVIIEFYAPWCQHCRSFEPIFLQTARKHKNVVFMKYNIMENQLPPQFEGKVESFPTTYMRRANDAELIKYGGGPSLESLSTFIEDTLKAKSSTPIDEADAASEGEESVASGESGHSHDSSEL